jgi:Ca2+:H+ antiporter
MPLLAMPPTIIALVALRAGLHDVVKASIAGSIVGNILLVLGAAMLAGGLRHSEQHFNAAGERVRFQVRSPMSANDP